MNKKYQMTFYKADFVQYNSILEDNEIRNKISNFLLSYVSLEAFYKKMRISMRESNGIQLTKKEKKNQPVTADYVEKTLAYFDIAYDEKLINRIFGSNDRNYMECSIKKLRDRLVHNVNENVLRTILERYDDIMTDLNEFSSLLR